MKNVKIVNKFLTDNISKFYTILGFCLRPKAKDLGITRVVVNLVVVLGFFICSMPYRHLPFPIYQYIIAADPGAGLSLVIIEI